MGRVSFNEEYFKEDCSQLENGIFDVVMKAIIFLFLLILPIASNAQQPAQSYSGSVQVERDNFKRFNKILGPSVIIAARGLDSPKYYLMGLYAKEGIGKYLTVAVSSSSYIRSEYYSINMRGGESLELSGRPSSNVISCHRRQCSYFQQTSARIPFSLAFSDETLRNGLELKAINAVDDLQFRIPGEYFSAMLAAFISVGHDPRPALPDAATPLGEK